MHIIQRRFFDYDQEKKDMRLKKGLDYFTFGAAQPGRTGGDSYRYGFNGQEKVDEITGSAGTDYDFGARMYDARLGRFFSKDPMANAYAHLSPYLFAENNPIYFIDDEGKNAVAAVDGNAVDGYTITVSSVILITGDGATAAKAAEMQAQIMGFYGPRTYTDENGMVYSIKFDIKVVIMPEPNWSQAEYNLVRLISPESAKALPAERRHSDGHLRSGVNPIWGWYGQWDSQADAATYAHETGHLLGYSDRYYEYEYNRDHDLVITNGLQGVKGVADYPNTASNELMGMAASDPSLKPKVTQTDIDALAKYVLANKDATGTVNLSYPAAKLNAPTPQERLKATEGGMKIVKPAHHAPPKAQPKEGHGDVRVFE